jgi:cobalt-zinc-cadmium efflux system outer membrane protein
LKNYSILRKLLVWSLFIVLSNKAIAQVDLNLHNALVRAIKYNPVILSEKQNIAAAGADIVTAGIRPNPVLNNQSLQLVSSNHFSQGTRWYQPVNQQIWWQFTKQIQLPGVRSSKIRYTKSIQNLTEGQFGETERQILAQVAFKWLDVWLAQKEMEIIKTAKNNIDSLLYINTLRQNKEVITKSDLLRTKVLAEQYAIQIKTMSQNYSNELKNLRYLTGSNDSINIDTSNMDFPPIKGSLDSLYKVALANRTDLRAALLYEESNRENIILQKKLGLPQPEIGAIYNPQNLIQYVGFYGTIPLPFFDRNQGNVKKASILLDQSRIQTDGIKMLIKNEIQIAYHTYQTQEKNLIQFDEILDQSALILKSVRYSYLRGGTTLIDLLEAQRSWIDIREQYYNALYTYRKAYIQLLIDTGSIQQLAR